MSKILITSALPYANGTIHFGHIAGAYLPADIYARFERMRQNDVAYICGSDEYGIAIELSAEQAKRSPKEHVDIYHAKNKELFQKMSISFAHYSRTTWPGHVETTYQYFNDLVANGYIEEKETEQLYSEKENRFLADRYVIGTCPKCGFEAARGDECTRCGQSFEATDLENPRSKLTGSPLALKKTRHWFLRLDLFKEKLLKWIDTKNFKPNVLNFIKSYIKDLRPRAITRDTSWGIPVPLEHAKNKVLYVWFDAPIGYISATKEWGLLQNNPDLWKTYWCDPETKLVHFVGKDNIPFHAVIFPAMTMGQNMPYKLVDDIPANEFFNLEGRQFSKSDGWYIDLEEFLKRYDVDQIRYYLAANAPETSDSEFTWHDFQQKCNSDLVGKFGNFIHRTLVFIQNKNGGLYPKIDTLDAADKAFLEAIDKKVDEIEAAYAGYRVRLASSLIMELATLGNTYFDAKKPWQLAKSPDTAKQMQTMLWACLECIKTLALVSHPIIPETSKKILALLGIDDDCQAIGWKGCRKKAQGKKLVMPQVLFSKIEDEQITKEIAMLAATSQDAKPIEQDPLVEKEKSKLVTFDEVKKIELRVAKVLQCEKVQKSNKLLKLTVTLGDHERTIVSGIAHKFCPEEMVGKHIVVVANLQPAKLMGIESQAMMLVGGSDDNMQILECANLAPGSIVS